MTYHSITLELPDKVYQHLKRRSQQTNRSLEEELLTAFALDLPILPLTATEAKELDFYVELGDFLGLLRAKALLYLQNNAES